MQFNTEVGGTLYQIGIDVGGTFTDFVFRDDRTGEELIEKIPSSPDDPSRAAIAGIEELCRRTGARPQDIVRVLHGTTVATNIMLQKSGARVGLITTEGFRDILHIARKKRPLNFSNYQDVPWQSSPLVERYLRVTVPERIVAPDGSVETPLDKAAVRQAVEYLVDQGVEAIAVCFLFSFLNPAHEVRVKEIAAEISPGLFVTCSHEVTPLHREYERFSTTALNAYVGPATASYVERFDRALEDANIGSGLRLMTSAGGLIGMRGAREKPVSLLFSGPVGALIKGVEIGRGLGQDSVITLDVGGTSADVGVAPQGRMLHKHILDTRIGDYDAMVPMVDLSTIGAGGGSIASVDSAGMFTVGPRSAGARPGPACFGYGGTDATVTDALLTLGWYREQTFARSGIEVTRELATEAIRRNVADPLSLSIEEAALGIYRIASRNMTDAIRVGSISKGYDARDFALIAFGGAGASFVADIADELSIPAAVVPPRPGVGAAAGLLSSDVRHEFMASCWGAIEDFPNPDFANKVGAMEGKARAELMRDGFAEADIRIHFQCDCRYEGQGYELTVDMPADLESESWRGGLAEAFHDAHEQHYLRRFDDKPIRIVNVRVVGIGSVGAPAKVQANATGDNKPVATAPCIFAGSGGWRSLETMFYDRSNLTTDAVLSGPAIVEQRDTTTIVPPGFDLRVDRLGNLILTKGADQ